MKAAGFEPVDVQSGYNGNELGAYMELRDNRVVVLRPHAGPRQAQRQLPDAGRDPRPVQRPADAGLGDVRPGAARQLGRAETQYHGYEADGRDAAVACVRSWRAAIQGENGPLPSLFQRRLQSSTYDFRRCSALSHCTDTSSKYLRASSIAFVSSSNRFWRPLRTLRTTPAS